MSKPCFTKFFKLLILLQIFVSIGTAQDNFTKLNDIVVTNNFDSLENIAAQQKNNPKALLNTLITLEYSKSIWASSKFATEVKRIDSLNNLVGTDFQKAMYYTFIGWQKYRTQAFKDEGHTNYIKALKLFEKLSDTIGIVYCYFYLYNLNFTYYENFELNKKAIIDYYNKICSLSVKSKNNFIQLLKLSATCEYYNRIEVDNGKFLNASEQAIDFVDKNPQFIYFKTPLLLKLAFYYYQNSDWNKATKTLAEALQTTSFKTSINKPYCEEALAEVYAFKNNPDSAFFWLRRSEKSIFENNTAELDLSLLSSIYKQLSIQKRAINQNDSAWFYREKSDSVLSAYQRIQNNQQFADLQTKYETEKKEDANRLLLNKEKNYKIAIAIGTLFTLVILLLSARLFSQNKKLKQLGFFRDNVFSIISHDLRSPLLALEGLSSQASFLMRHKKTDDLIKVADKVDGSVLQISNLLSNLLIWARSHNIKNKSEKSQFIVSAVVDDTIKLYADICQAQGIVVQQNASTNMHIFASKNVLELMLRNWLDNTIKHSNATIVDISANSINKAIQVIIKTNSVTAAETLAKIQDQIHHCNTLKLKTSTGLGLSLMCSFARQEGWTLDFTSNGTSASFFTISIPQ